MKTLEKINIVDVLKISALIGLVFALLMSIVYASVTSYTLYQQVNLKAISATPAEINRYVLTTSVMTGLVMWIGSIVFGVLSCVFYNIFAKWVGGIRYEDKEHIHVKKEEHGKKEEKK